MSQFSRRQFLCRLAALACGTIGGHLLVACQPASDPAAPAQPLPDPTATTLPPTEVPTPAPSATPTLVPLPPKPEIIRFHPDAPSTVVHARHSGAWQGKDLSPTTLHQMLDASIVALTGLADAGAAWKALFRPNERIGIKVNTIRNGLFWTHAPLVTAVAECLQEAGVPAEQIVIYDRASDELTNAGYTINRDGPGVRCYATDGEYTRGFKVAGMNVGLSNILFTCDALINMPLLKSHALSGFTFALKNHFGTFNMPETFHSDRLLQKGIPELNALPPIRDRARLVIGDALTVCLKEATSWPYWREAETGDSLLMGYDPVAVDTAALAVWSQVKTAKGEDPAAAQAKANVWLKGAAEMGLGTHDEANMKLVALALG